jgi:rubrerythrin
MTRDNAHQYLKKVYLTTKNDSFREALSVALAALRGPTREQVEKVWRGRWQRGTKDWVCSRCGRSHTFVKSFCPNCGAPMTDEAAQMVMRRLEALKDGKTD